MNNHNLCPNCGLDKLTYLMSDVCEFCEPYFVRDVADEGVEEDASAPHNERGRLNEKVRLKRAKVECEQDDLLPGTLSSCTAAASSETESSSPTEQVNSISPTLSFEEPFAPLQSGWGPKSYLEKHRNANRWRWGPKSYMRKQHVKTTAEREKSPSLSTSQSPQRDLISDYGGWGPKSYVR